MVVDSFHKDIIYYKIHIIFTINYMSCILLLNSNILVYADFYIFHLSKIIFKCSLCHILYNVLVYTIYISLDRPIVIYLS